MAINLIPLLPASEVLLTGLVVLILNLFLKEHERGILPWICIVGLAIASGMAFFLWGSFESAFRNTLVLDHFSLFFTQLFVGVAAVTILSSVHYVKEIGIAEGEYYSLILFSTGRTISISCAEIFFDNWRISGPTLSTQRMRIFRPAFVMLTSFPRPSRGSAIILTRERFSRRCSVLVIAPLVT